MIKLYYFPVLGTIITDKSNNKMYLFNNDKSKYMIVSSSEMEEVSQSYKYGNILNKPFNVLVYEQVFKKRSHGLKVTKTLTESELSDFIADKELVK